MRVRAWRMVAAAFKPAPVGQQELSHDDLQNGLIFLGIAGMMDPPRPEAIDAIHACQPGRDPREDDHRRPPANGDEHWSDAGHHQQRAW